PFLRLNACKAEQFEELAKENTRLGNEILALPFEQRRALTTKAYAAHPLAAYWANQTIRNVKQSRRTRAFKRLPLETNNQGWTLTKVGDTFSIGFTLTRGGKGKRVPLAVHAANHQHLLERLLAKDPG